MKDNVIETNSEFTIYNNIIKYIKGLGYELTKKPETVLEFSLIMQVVQFVEIQAHNTKNKKIQIFQICSHAGKLKSMYGKMNKDTNIIIVGDLFVNRSKAIVTHGSKKFNVTYLNNSLFKIDITNNVMVPPHYLCSEDDKKDIMKYNGITDISQFPKIKYHDPQVILLDGQVGQLVKIKQKNVITGESMYYRIIIP